MAFHAPGAGTPVVGNDSLNAELAGFALDAYRATIVAARRVRARRRSRRRWRSRPSRGNGLQVIRAVRWPFPHRTRESRGAEVPAHPDFELR